MSRFPSSWLYVAPTTSLLSGMRPESSSMETRQFSGLRSSPVFSRIRSGFDQSSVRPSKPFRSASRKASPAANPDLARYRRRTASPAFMAS